MSLNNAHEGYDYQDLITSYFILKEVLDGNLDSIFSIDKKNTTGKIPDRFDDLVIVNGSDIQRKQIKYSNETKSKVLIKDYLSSDSHYSIALHKLFETWKELKTPSTEFRLCLAWEEPTNDDITRVLELQTEKSSFSEFPTKVFKINLDRLWTESPENFNRWDSLSRYVRDNDIDRIEFNEFCNSLLIEVGLPKASLKFNTPSELEIILIEQAHRLGIGKYPNDDVYIPDFLERLAKLSGAYRTGSIQVSANDILSALHVRTDFGSIKQKFEIDQNKNIISDEKNNKFINKVVINRKTLLLGEPGAGKSWFLTNFIEFLRRNDRVVIRHYCFTSTEDSHFDQRVNSDVFFGNLIGDVEKYFPKVRQKKQQLYASNLDELNLVLSAIETPMIIIVDGLDHINRVLQTSATLSKEKTKIIEYISRIELPNNVSIVLGSQPIDEVEHLAERFEFIKVSLPKWSILDTAELMKRFGYDDIQVDDQNLSVLLHEKSEGSPLYLTYILKTLGKPNAINRELVESLPKYDFNLKNYYEYLTSQIINNSTSEILSCLDFSVSRKELKEIIPMKHHFDADIKVLSPVISENSSRGGIKLYHDSFRRFNIEKLSSFADLNDIYTYIIKWLSENGFYSNDKSYRYLLNYLILSGQYDEAGKYADNNFLSKSLYFGHSEKLIKNNYKNFLHVAEKSQDWSLFIYAAELHRAIATTNSEENHSQFLESFELYFEAICSIYGVEKANALLFFNGEKNFSDRHTAKGFKTLQKYGYSPYWKKIKGLFEGGVVCEDFKYFMCYQIQENNDLTEIFTSILSEQYSDYLRVFIVEVFEQKGFDAIAYYYQGIDNDDGERIARSINSALDSVSSKKKIPVASKSQLNELEPLSLDFITGYIKSSELSRFYFNVEKYLESDITALIEFEEQIPSSNFFHNWIKYFIRLLILEHETSHACKESSIVENIKFLASDTCPYKGTPRVIDFSHENSGLIDQTIIKSLRYIESKAAWEEVITELNKIPYPTISIIENKFLNENNLYSIINSYELFGQSEDEDYSQYAEYSFKKSIYYGKINELDKAKEELRKALKLITSYTFRKDTTLSEIIKPLYIVNKVDSEFAKQYVKKLKYLTDAVMKHTEDGKDTRWLTIDWFEKLLSVDYKLASLYLIHELLINEYFWKLDYMFIYYLQESHHVDPIILNFLYKLSPTNNRDSYLNGFLDVITKLVNIDEKLAELSLINLSSRAWNDSYNTLNNSTEVKFYGLLEQFGLSKYLPIKSSKKEAVSHSFNNQKLTDLLTQRICREDSLRLKNGDELRNYYDEKDRLSDEDFNFLYFYLQEINDEEFTNDLLVLIIKKRFPGDVEEHYKKISSLIETLPLSEDTKIFLFVYNFVYSKDGWYSSFVNKESLSKAIEFNKEKSLLILSKALREIFGASGFLYKYTANIIIAFEYAGLSEDAILSMYKRSFDFIENRLPSTSDFTWNNVESLGLSEMNDNELAIVFILSKSKNLDAFVQKEIIVAISYILRYDEKLLIKPLGWLFNNIKNFSQLFVASVLELLLIEIGNHPLLFDTLKDKFRNALQIDNLYIHNTLQDILNGFYHE